MKDINILIIPAEGDSVDTESWYVNDVSCHYATNQVKFSSITVIGPLLTVYGRV